MKWTWRQGSVSDASEHMLLLYGDAGRLRPEQFIPAARVSPPQAGTFTVQFLVGEDQPAAEVLASVRQDLDFLLLEEHAPDRWGYARYHCTTASNWYSRVHWVYRPDGIGGTDGSRKVDKKTGTA